MPPQYGVSRVAVDLVVFSIRRGKLHVLLQVREKEPYAGMLELPGGLLLPTETAEATLKRKLQDLVGHAPPFFRQFHTFTEPGRDPRYRTVSIGFVSLVPEESLGDLAPWHEYDGIGALAFDHAAILHAARAHIREHLDASIVKRFMPETFPLNRLQEVYEILEATTYDNRNFRKKMLGSGLIRETRQLERNVSHRPARLFRFV